MSLTFEYVQYIQYRFLMHDPLCVFLPTIAQDIVKGYIELSFDKLPELMSYLHSLLMQPSPTVIYTHCEVRIYYLESVFGYVIAVCLCLVASESEYV